MHICTMFFKVTIHKNEQQLPQHYLDFHFMAANSGVAADTAQRYLKQLKETLPAEAQPAIYIKCIVEVTLPQTKKQLAAVQHQEQLAEV